MAKKRPPTFKEKGEYKQWKDMVNVWLDVCDVSETEKASLIVLEIENSKAVKAALRVLTSKY